MTSLFLRRTVLLWILCGGLAPAAAAATVELDSAFGLMQQPTSHYYLAMYGVAASAQSDTQGLIVRGSYVERPESRDAGFLDKDSAWFALVGTKVTKEKDRGLYAFAGLGRVGGYVKVDRGVNATAGQAQSSYSLSGPTVAAEYAIHFGRLDVAIGHQVFVGYVDRAQLDAYVAWPYNFYQANFGVTW